MKKNFKKRIAKVLATIMTASMVFGLVGCGGAKAPSENEQNAVEDTNKDGKKRVAFISPANQFDFFVYIGAEVKKIGEEKGIRVDMFDAALDVNKLADLMSQAIIQDYDAIIVGPVDTEAVVPSIKEANEAGIPVINYDSFIEGADVYARVGSGNVEMGQLAGEHAVEMLKEKYGKVEGNITVLSYPQLETMNKRIEGFKAAFKDYPDVSIKEETVDAVTAEAGQTLTDNLLVANGEGKIDIIYGSNAGVLLGALAAVSSANRTDIALVGIDNEEGQLNALKDGTYYKGTIAQDSYAIGEAAMEAAIKAMDGEKTGDVVVPGILVTPENVDEYLQNDKDTKAELDAYK